MGVWERFKKWLIGSPATQVMEERLSQQRAREEAQARHRDAVAMPRAVPDAQRALSMEEIAERMRRAAEAAREADRRNAALWEEEERQRRHREEDEERRRNDAASSAALLWTALGTAFVSFDPPSDPSPDPDPDPTSTDLGGGDGGGGGDFGGGGASGDWS